MMRYYTGIGSRETPAEILDLMTAIARRYAEQGWCLRSGGAEGADTAFEQGAGAQQIFLPWNGFNGRDGDAAGYYHGATPEAYTMAREHHPAWSRCSPAARKLHARNSHQIFGPLMNEPSELVICWTRDAMGGGGTGQALRIARAHGIPVFDLADDVVVAKMCERLGLNVSLEG